MNVSIIIPVYNVERYIKYCVDSIVNQSYSNFELILINDGSTDQSGKICDKYASEDSRIKVFHVDNGGASKARNIGIDHASGEWISFVDADDWVAPDYLETFVNIQDKADITFFNAFQVHPDENRIIRKHKGLKANGRIEAENALCSLKYGNLGDIMGWTWDKFFRISIIKKHTVRFVEGLVFREDEIFTMDYCRYIHSLEIIEKPLYHYRITNTGLTANGIQRQDYLLLAEHLIDNLPFYHNHVMVSRDKQRIADYFVQDMLNKANKLNLWTSNASLHEFVLKYPEIAQYASNQNLIMIQKHRYWLSCLLLQIRWIASAMLSRLSL